MDYLIENIYVDTENLVHQTYKKLLQKRKILWAVVSIILSILFALAGFVLKKTIYTTGAVVYAGLAVWYWLWPYRAAKKEYKKMLKFYDGVIPETVVRFGETITFRQLDSVTTIPYNKLNQISILKDCILLHNEMGGAHLVSKDGFTKGSEQEMLALLKEKCSKLELPDWKW